MKLFSAYGWGRRLRGHKTSRYGHLFSAAILQNGHVPVVVGLRETIRKGEEVMSFILSPSSDPPPSCPTS